MLRRLGPYSLLRRIASGGMAEVYLAAARGEDGTERRVAIKLLHPHSADDPELVEMLVQEARLHSQLRHRNIVATYDLAQQGGRYYIVMELVEGLDLFQTLRQAAEREVEFPFEVAAYVAREVALGLDYAHRKLDDRTGQPLQVVHRDVSPHNVLLSHAGEVKLTDFGIARVAQRAAPTQAGVLKGKYAYMSPEQAWGDPVDARTDIFSTGILLHEMLCGQMLYREEDRDRLLERVRRAEIPPPGRLRQGLPRDLEQIVMKALRRRPSDRWPTAGDLAQALQDFLRGYAPSCQPEQELVALLARVGVQPARSGRGADEATAALPQPRTFVPPPRLDVPDDNSLLFPASRRPSLADEDPFGGPTSIEQNPWSLDRLDGSDGEDAEPTSLMDEMSAPPSGDTPRIETRWAPPSPPPRRPSASLPPPALPAPSWSPSLRPSSTVPAVPPAGPREPQVLLPRLPAPPAGSSSAPSTITSRPAGITVPLAAPTRPLPVPPELSQRQRRNGMLAAFLLAMAVGASGVLVILLGPLAPPRAQIEVVSTPPGATVLLDGRPVETPTPVRILGVDAGQVHRLTIRLPGYRPWETEVRFEGRELSRAVQAVLVPAR